MAFVHALFKGNDHLIEIRGLMNVAEGDFENAATVTMVALKDSAGDDVGAVWPLTLSYVTGSHGKYRGIVQDDLPLTTGSRYTAVVTADAGPGKRGEWNLEFICRNRAL